MTKKQKPETTGLNLPEIALDALLSFLKDTRGAVNWSAKDLLQGLRLDAKQGAQLLAILEMQGYVAKEGNEWLTTAAGESISKSKKPQFSLASVTQAMATLKERIAALNRDKRSEFEDNEGGCFRGFSDGTTSGAGRRCGSRTVPPRSIGRQLRRS
jgi:hypothetical protein